MVLRRLYVYIWLLNSSLVQPITAGYPVVGAMGRSEVIKLMKIAVVVVVVVVVVETLSHYFSN